MTTSGPIAPVERHATPLERWAELAGGRRRPTGSEAAAVGLLTLLSVPYGIAASVIQWIVSARPSRLRVPVISVGNLVVGGTGKTPFVVLLARRLAEQGRAVAVVSRGYGRSGRGIVVVSRGAGPIADWERAGDEPRLVALLTEQVRVITADDRTRGARFAVDKLAADVIVLDDAFQHVGLARDLDIVTVDASSPVGNGFLLPGGTLREHPLGIGRADVVVATRCRPGVGSGVVAGTLGPLLKPGTPIVETRMKPVEFWDVGTGGRVRPADVRGRPALALSSIANGRDFEETVGGLGLEVRSAVSFPDHHRYSEEDRAFVVDRLHECGGEFIVTTEKDAVRLAAWRPPVPLVALGIETEIVRGGRELDRALDTALSSGGMNGA
jgi:tetraacyldisaccharide 4'-kinase